MTHRPRRRSASVHERRGAARRNEPTSARWCPSSAAHFAKACVHSESQELCCTQQWNNNHKAMLLTSLKGVRQNPEKHCEMELTCLTIAKREPLLSPAQSWRLYRMSPRTQDMFKDRWDLSARWWLKKKGITWKRKRERIPVFCSRFLKAHKAAADCVKGESQKSI